MGRGRGHRNVFGATGLTGWLRAQMGRSGTSAGSRAELSREQELATLRLQAERLERTLGELRSRIEDLEEGEQAGPVANEQEDR